LLLSAESLEVDFFEAFRHADLLKPHLAPGASSEASKFSAHLLYADMPLSGLCTADIRRLSQHAAVGGDEAFSCAAFGVLPNLLIQLGAERLTTSEKRGFLFHTYLRSRHPSDLTLSSNMPAKMPIMRAAAVANGSCRTMGAIMASATAANITAAGTTAQFIICKTRPVKFFKKTRRLICQGMWESCFGVVCGNVLIYKAPPRTLQLAQLPKACVEKHSNILIGWKHDGGRSAGARRRRS
jgi:hypothetical protein